MNKLRELILGNFYIKLLSFSIAIVLWFVTMNINNPVIDKDISVPLTLKNEYLITDKDYVVVNKEQLESTYIQVKIKGKRNDIDSYRHYSDAVTATVDLSQVDLSNEAILGQPISVPISVNTSYPEVFTIVGMNPLTVIVNIDIVETKTIPVYAEVKGTPKSSYVIQGTPVLSKSSITITGPRSVLRDVNRAVVTLDIEGAMGDIDKDVKPTILNSSDVDVTSAIYTGLDPINVKQKVSKATTVEIVPSSLIGDLPEGYSLIEYTTDITSLDVLADETNPNLSFNPIVLDTIDVTNLTETTTFKEDITQKLLEQGLKVDEGESSVITTTVVVAQDTQKTLTIPITSIEFSSVDYAYVVEETEFTINVAGIENVINSVEASDFSFYCELPSTSEPGQEFSAIVDVTTPENVKLITVPTIKVKVE